MLNAVQFAQHRVAQHRVAQYRVAQHRGPEVLRLVEAGEPHAGPGEVRIAVRAAGVNPIDWTIQEGYLRERMPRPLPSGTGMEAAGVVDEVGAGVHDASVGDAVFGLGAATWAQHAVLAAWAPKPGPPSRPGLRLRKPPARPW